MSAVALVMESAADTSAQVELDEPAANAELEPDAETDTGADTGADTD